MLSFLVFHYSFPAQYQKPSCFRPGSSERIMEENSLYVGVEISRRTHVIPRPDDQIFDTTIILELVYHHLLCENLTNQSLGSASCFSNALFAGCSLGCSPSICSPARHTS
jgi:hypothetical protein